MVAHYVSLVLATRKVLKSSGNRHTLCENAKLADSV